MIKKIATLSSVTIATSYLYVKVREKRSYKSFLYELMLKITNTKSSFENVENAQKSLDAVKEETKGLYNGTEYRFKHRVQATTVQQSTVYTINNQSDRQQQVVLYIHGGAWFQNPMKNHFDYIDTLASELNAKIVLPIYPKVPHATYKETFTLLKEIYESIVREVEDPHQIIVMGDSAGGQIALSFAQYIKMQSLPQPSNIILISPVLDATLSNPESAVYEEIDPMLAREGSKFFLELWSGDLSLTDWRVSPMFGDLEGLGHITLIIGTKETLYPDVLKLSNMLNKKNISHDFLPGYNLFHIYPVFPIPERAQVITKLKQIIKKY